MSLFAKNLVLQLVGLALRGPQILKALGINASLFLIEEGLWQQETKARGC